MKYKIKDLRVSIHQINTITGDLDGNSQKIIDLIKQDADNKVDLSVFPETAISGYMCGSLWDKSDFVMRQAVKLEKIVDSYKTSGHKGVVIVGFVDYQGNKKNGFPKLRNSVAVISSKDVVVISKKNASNTVNRTVSPNHTLISYNKQILASADHHEDIKYFQKGSGTYVFEVEFPKVGKVIIGTPICEDVWFTDHLRNIPQEMVDLGAELLVVPNQSYFYYGKQAKRIDLYSKISKDNKVPIVTVNSCGVGDILKNIVAFDGGSMIFDDNGDMLMEMKQFKEENIITDMSILNKIEPITKNKYEEITNAIIFEQKEFFSQLGLKKAQIHVSGGIDSALVAALVVESMGKENTVLISNPTSLNVKSIQYVNKLQEALGIEVIWNPLQDIYEKFVEVDTESFGSKLNDTGLASIQAVLRTVQGIAASHRFGTGIVATGNHTEIVLGWASFHDIGSIGVHAIIGDLTKLEIFDLSNYLNTEYFKREVIPTDLYNGKFKPAAELPDANEDPINYNIQSGICASLIRDRKSKLDLIHDKFNHKLNPDYFPNYTRVYDMENIEFKREVDFAVKCMNRSVYKAAQGAPTFIISPRSRGFSNRETLLNKYKE